MRYILPTLLLSSLALALPCAPGESCDRYSVLASPSNVSFATDYGFLGFTYASCGDGNQADRDLGLMRSLGARHVRLYGWCNDQWLSRVLDAAGKHGMGVIPIIWWGYSDQEYRDARRKEDVVVNTIKSHR